MDAVGATRELAVHPDFDGVGVAFALELAVDFDETIGNPDPIVFALGAGSHDLLESLIESDYEAALLECAGEAFRDVELRKWQDSAPLRQVPGVNRRIFMAHREDAFAIPFKNLVRIQMFRHANHSHILSVEVSRWLRKSVGAFWGMQRLRGKR